jgi:hypothetical protein
MGRSSLWYVSGNCHRSYSTSANTASHYCLIHVKPPRLLRWRLYFS